MSRCLKSALATLTLMLAMTAVTPVTAQEDSGRDWYTVEVIVFRNWSGADTEQFRPDVPPPAFQQLTVLRSGGQRAFRRLAGSELALQGARQRLEKSPDYEVLTHFGWEQPALAEEEAISIPLPLGWQPSPLSFNASRHPLGIPVITPPEPRQEEAGAAADDNTAGSDQMQDGPVPPPQPSIFDELPGKTQLYGTLTLFRGRYLHIDADLRYRLRRYQASWTERERAVAPPVYVLDQRRRMRSDELHYLDHPAIGVLVKVTPVEESAETGDGGDNAKAGSGAGD